MKLMHALAALVLAGASHAIAQDSYPPRPIALVVQFAAS